MSATLDIIGCLSEIEELLASNAGRVGASTGYMTGARGDWPRLLAAAEALSHDVVELSALSAAELPALRAFLDDGEALPFAHVSVHGPSKDWNGTPAQLVAELATLPAQVEGMVMHPETLGDPALFAALGARLWLENMDTRKPDGRTPDELARFFAALPDARFCFDVAHAWLHDPTMALAHALLDAFADRLAEVHVSSIERSGEHVPLRPQDAEAFAPVLERCVGVPWVLEAPVPGRP
jgi:xylose isomerase-like TIM barrel protein